MPTTGADSITAAGRAKAQVVWELSVKKIDEHTCEYSNHIHASATDKTMAFFKEHGISFEKANGLAAGSRAHNREETPNFAKSVER
jgi:hypothetical protein